MGGGSVQSTTGRRAVRISLQALYCSCKPVFCSHVTLTGYPLHSPVSPSLPPPHPSVCAITFHLDSTIVCCTAEKGRFLDIPYVWLTPLGILMRQIHKTCRLQQLHFFNFWWLPDHKFAHPMIRFHPKKTTKLPACFRSMHLYTLIRGFCFLELSSKY